MKATTLTKAKARLRKLQPTKSIKKAVPLTIKKEIQKKYFNISDFQRTYADTKYVRYQINFIDGTHVSVIMTEAQRNAIMRSKFGKYINTIGGEGYQVKKTSLGKTTPAGRAKKTIRKTASKAKKLITKKVKKDIDRTVKKITRTIDRSAKSCALKRKAKGLKGVKNSERQKILKSIFSMRKKLELLSISAESQIGKQAWMDIKQAEMSLRKVLRENNHRVF